MGGTLLAPVDEAQAWVGPRAPSGARASSGPTLAIGGRTYTLTRDGGEIFATGARGARYMWLRYAEGDADLGHFFTLPRRSLPGSWRRSDLEARLGPATADDQAHAGHAHDFVRGCQQCDRELARMRGVRP
jgi:hypothetical protein